MTTKKKKAPTVSKLKAKLWKIFSEYIRRKYANLDGYVECCTCGAFIHWKQAQAGHYCSRRHNATLFREDNVHPQCIKCNMFNQGNIPEYVRFLDTMYGADRKYELLEASKQIRQFKPFELEEMIEHYSNELKKLP